MITSLACYPRLAFWPGRPYPVWYVAAVLFLNAMILWAFVFAWHTKYAQRPVFGARWEPAPYAGATIAAISLAAILRLFLDPSLRLDAPGDYPASLEEWVAMTLFGLAFNQLFLVFAPFAWFVWVFQRRWIAVLLTILFGVFVTVIKRRTAATPPAPALFAALLMVRVIGGFLSVYFYLRGGLWLAWWWSLLLQARHLPDLIGGH